MVANVKNPKLLKLSTLEASLILQERLRVEAAPVLVARDFNRLQFLSEVLTAVSLELRSVMIAWGDRYPASAKTSNVRDFSSLSEAIRESSLVSRRARASTCFFAPVDMGRLVHPEGVALARGRLKAGAEYLLAQPPTVDAEATFDEHASLLESSGLKDKVLLNVFPFKDEKDVKQCEKYFGWKLPDSLHLAAAKGAPALVEMERMVEERLKEEKFPGVYLTTRGTPAVAAKLLS